MMNFRDVSLPGKGIRALFFGIIFLLAGLFLLRPLNAEAASWQKLDFDNNNGSYKTVTVGKYTFKYSQKAAAGSGKVKMKKGSGSYKSTPLTDQTWTNGKTAYYVKNNYLCKYSLSSKKSSRMRKLPATSASDGVYYVSKVYSGCIFITYDSFDAWKYKTYCYNTKKKTLKMVKNNCRISVSSGKYCVCERRYRSDVSPIQYDLFKISGSGSLKKVKTLSKKCVDVWLVGGKFYYTKYAAYGSGSNGKVTLYRCKKDGTSAKKLGTFYGKGGEMLTISKVTSKYCTFFPNSSGLTTYYY